MSDFSRPRRLETDFQRALGKLMRQWLHLPAKADLDEIFSALAQSGNRGLFDVADRLAYDMVTAVARGNATSWRKAAAQGTQGRRIHDLLRNEMSGPVGVQMRAYVSANARLIKSLPQDLAQDVAKQIATRQMQGLRAEVIAEDIRSRIGEITNARLQMLSRTQVSTTATAISRARATNLSLPAYVWDTSEDIRVRPSHRKMDHVIVFWTDPPSPEKLIGVKSTLGAYHAGQCPLCRCDPSVITDLDELTWPHLVHEDGSITRMSRRAFANRSGM